MTVGGDTKVPLPLPLGNGLTAGEITVQAGTSAEHGNVVVSCPAGDAACVLTVSEDGTATYAKTGGMPGFMSAQAPGALPASHGLAAGEITVQAGTSAEHGNVVVSCPAGDAACVLTVSEDGTATYAKTGGMPGFVSAQAPGTLPASHGLAAGEITVQAGTSAEHGNLVVSCPAGDAACVLTVSEDGTATYAKTGGMPGFMSAHGSWALPAGHGLAAGEITVQAGTSAEHGNVVVSCPAGDAACVLTVSEDDTATYAKTGGMPGFATDGLQHLNALSESTKNATIVGLVRGRRRDVVSSAAAGGTGVTKYSWNQDTHWTINAQYIGPDLVFERRDLVAGTTFSTKDEPAAPGYRNAFTIPGSTRWKGVEHFSLTQTGDRVFSVFYSDITDNGDMDYLAGGLTLLLPSSGNGEPSVTAAASGNDPFPVGNIAPLEGRAAYEGDAAGLYVARDLTPAFQYFSADVRLTADFDENEIWGVVTGFRDTATNEQIPGELALDRDFIQTDEATFFRSYTTGVVNGKRFRGEWGGQFFGSGGSGTDPPGSVAGVFDAGTTDDRSEYLVGIFAADHQTTPAPPDTTPPDTGDGYKSRMVTALNNLPESVRDKVSGRVTAAARRDVVSSTDTETDADTGDWNTGVIQSSRNWSGIRENSVIHAEYMGDDLVFEKRTLTATRLPIFNTNEIPDASGNPAAISSIPGLSNWKGVEHFFVTSSGGRYRSGFYSDITDNDDTDYLAGGIWVWHTDPDDPTATSNGWVTAAASGNDPFEVGNIEPLEGEATYEGDATGLYAAKDATPAFRHFGADVRLIADFDVNEIAGIVTDGRDVATDRQLFEGLVLHEAGIQTSGAAFFNGNTRGVVAGKYVEGDWGGQFFDNGGSPTDPPGSVAGTFGGRARDDSVGVVGFFGAYRQP